MEMPQWLQGDSLKHIALSFIAGCVALAFVGFNAGWVVLASTANEMAKEQETAAVVKVYTPVCVRQFMANATAEQRKKFDSEQSWMRDTFVKNAGFATPPGFTEVDGLPAACATGITEAQDADKEPVKKAQAK